jgi:hypothetical protein
MTLCEFSKATVAAAFHIPMCEMGRAAEGRCGVDRRRQPRSPPRRQESYGYEMTWKSDMDAVRAIVHSSHAAVRVRP